MEQNEQKNYQNIKLRKVSDWLRAFFNLAGWINKVPQLTLGRRCEGFRTLTEDSKATREAFHTVSSIENLLTRQSKISASVKVPSLSGHSLT